MVKYRHNYGCRGDSLAQGCWFSSGLIGEGKGLNRRSLFHLIACMLCKGSVFLFLIALILGSGCDFFKRSSVSSEQELYELITPGMTVAEVKKIFGNPTFKSEEASIELWTYYLIPPDDGGVPKKSTEYVGKVVVRMKDGRVEGCRHEMQTLQVMGDPFVHTNEGKRNLQLVFATTEEMTNLVDAVSREGLVDASKVDSSAGITCEIELVDQGEGGDGKRYLTIKLSKEDTAKLNEMTEMHMGKPLLMIYKGKLLAAPKVNFTLPRNAFMLSLSDERALEHLFKK
ncbi:MAG: hypothetical protein EOM59_18230 [Clostridia bacterium]|nr:hypothetical protein [Clostridia bacterium]